MNKQKNEIGYDIEDLIEKAKEYVPENSLVHAKSFLIGHQFNFAFEEVVELFIRDDIAIPKQLFESINSIGIYLGLKRDVWSSLGSPTNDP